MNCHLPVYQNDVVVGFICWKSDCVLFKCRVDAETCARCERGEPVERPKVEPVERPKVEKPATKPATKPRPKDSDRVLPPLRKQIANLAVAVGQAIVDPRLCSAEQRDARLAVCHACEWLVDGRCTGKEGCGCFVEFKATLKVWNCPRGKW